MFAQTSAIASPTSPSHRDKKRKFSFFRNKDSKPIVTVLDREPPEVTPLSPMFTSSTSEASETSGSPRTGDSVTSSGSAASSSNHASSSAGRVLETATAIEDVAPDGLPTYASATHPTVPMTYSFARSSPFAMVLTQDGATDVHMHGLYYISVDVNVWMPSSTVTTIRRGASEVGPVVASIELGMSSVPATVTVGNVCKNLNQLYFRKSTMSRSRLYFTGEGAIKWKLGSPSWQAHLNDTLLANFSPDTPYKLTVQPKGHRLLDHLIVSLVILMREHLTPAAGMRGDSAPLFNYSVHHNFQED